MSPAEGLPLTPGQIVAGKYRIERLLGEGGMGVVLAATDMQLERRVAMKVMQPDHAKSRDAVQRFVREGRAAAKLRSEHAAQVYEVGTTEQGTPYMVMEFLDGADLSAVLAQQRQLRIEDAVDYVLQACEAIAEAHAAGIVHRDLKPQNLFLTRHPSGRPHVKVLDFGISKVMTQGMPTELTMTGAALGTPLYMAPEQMRSARGVDARVDIWALGIILYELVTGRVPFLGQSVTEVVMKVAQDAPEPPRSLRHDLPPALQSVILRCLAKSPADRYPSVAALVADLEPFTGRVPAPRVSSHDLSAQAVGIPAPRPIVSSSPTLENAPTVSSPVLPPDPGGIVNTDASWGRTGERAGRVSRSGRMAIIAGGVFLGTLVAAGGVWLAVARPWAAQAPPTAAATAATLAAPPPTETAIPTQASPTAPVQAADLPKVVRLAIGAPSGATVDVDGARTPIAGGSIDVSGPIGSVHHVRIAFSGRETRADVVITQDGPVPPRVDLGASSRAGGGAVARPAATPASPTPAQPTAPRPATPAAPTIDRSM